jgi:hypothetical protein
MVILIIIIIIIMPVISSANVYLETPIFIFFSSMQKREGWPEWFSNMNVIIVALIR